MQIKKTIKICIYFLLCIIIVIAGMYAFTQITHKKETFQIDLYTLIPEDVTLIVQTTDPQKLAEKCRSFSFLLPEKNIFKLTNLFAGELLLSFHSNGSLLFTKLDENSYKYLSNDLFESKFSSFSSKKESHNGVEIIIIPCQDGHFFCYTYHKGIFIASYNKKLVESAIEMYTNGSNLKKNPAFNSCLEKSNRKAFANLLIRKEIINLPRPILLFNDWIGCNIEMVNDDLLINGTIPDQSSNNLFYKFIMQSTGQDKPLNEKIIPENVQSLIQLNIDSLSLKGIILDSLLFQSVDDEGGIYSFNYTDTTNAIFKTFNVAYFKISPNHLTDFTKRIARKRVEYPAFNEYMNSSDIKSLFPGAFNPDSMLVFTLYNGYFLIGEDKESIVHYIGQLPQSDSISHPNSLIELSSNYPTEATIIYWKTIDLYDFLLRINKSDGTPTFNIEVRKSTMNL